MASFFFLPEFLYFCSIHNLITNQLKTACKGRPCWLSALYCFVFDFAPIALCFRRFFYFCLLITIPFLL